MSTRGVQRSMDLFLQFPFNNVLHRHVANLVTAMDTGTPRLAEFLVQDCQLLTWLVDAPLEVRAWSLSLPSAVCPRACRDVQRIFPCAATTTHAPFILRTVCH